MRLPTAFAATRIFTLLAPITLAASALDAQRTAQKVAVSKVLTAFLVDSGVRTRGLPWTTGSELPIRWATPRPVANQNPPARARGITLLREGTFTGTLGDSVALPMSLTLWGSTAGLTSVTVGLNERSATRGEQHQSNLPSLTRPPFVAGSH